MAVTWIEHEIMLSADDAQRFDVWKTRRGVRALEAGQSFGDRRRGYLSATATPNGWRQLAVEAFADLETLLELEALIVGATGRAQKLQGDAVYEAFNYAVCVANGEEDFDADAIADDTALSADRQTALLRFGRTVIFCQVEKLLEAETYLSENDASVAFDTLAERHSLENVYA